MYALREHSQVSQRLCLHNQRPLLVSAHAEQLPCTHCSYERDCVAAHPAEAAQAPAAAPMRAPPQLLDMSANNGTAILVTAGAASEAG